MALERRARRYAILHAIGEHDNGWEEPDAAPTVDPQTGTAVDFVNAPVSVRQGVWPRAISRLANDPWAAALVAHHAVTVYERFRTDPAWTSFFAEMERARDTHVEATGLSFDDLVADYPFLRLGDLISLTFCTGVVGEVQFGTWTIRSVDSSITVRPDLFGGATVPFEVRARDIPNQAFRLDDELRMVCETAITIMLRGDMR